MAFKFSVSEIEFNYQGVDYELPINARLAVDLERTIGMHPLTLAQKISQAGSKGEIPPMGLMAEFFEFMLKRAGARSIDFDEIYGELFGGDNASEIGEYVGNLLSIFIPSSEDLEIDPKSRKPRKPGKK